MSNQFDPENLRVTAFVDAQRAEPGKRLVYDKARKDFVDPKDLPISLTSFSLRKILLVRGCAA